MLRNGYDREYHTQGDSVSVRTTSGEEMVALIAATLGMSVAQLDADLDRWLKTVITVG